MKVAVVGLVSQAVKKQLALDPSSPDVHCCLVRIVFLVVKDLCVS